MNLNDVNPALASKFTTEQQQIAILEQELQEMKAMHSAKSEETEYVLQFTKQGDPERAHVKDGKLHLYVGCICDCGWWARQPDKPRIKRSLDALGLSGIVMHFMSDKNPDRKGPPKYWSVEGKWYQGETHTNCNHVPLPIPDMLEIVFDYNGGYGYPDEVIE